MGARRPFLDLGKHSRPFNQGQSKGFHARIESVSVDNRNEISAIALRSEQMMKVNPSWRSCFRKAARKLIQAALENQVIYYSQFHKDRRGEERNEPSVDH
jgi:hypothetical protein